jgi:hypothetical protein
LDAGGELNLAFWSRRTTLVTLLAIVLLSIVFRYPLVEHERYQTDSYSIHHLSDTIAIEGYVPWTFHPISYIGYYPLSYPTGIPVALAEFSLMTGLSVESSILILDVIVAMAFCLGVFLLVRIYIVRQEFALLATLLAVLGPRFIDTTYWDASARSSAVVFIVLLVLSLVRMAQNGDRKLLGIAALFCFGCLAVHHMAIVILLFALAYVVVTFQTSYAVRLLGLRRQSSVAALHIATAVFIIVAPFLLFEFFFNVALRVLGSSSVVDLDSPLLTIVIAAGISYTSQIGLVVLFAAAYLPVLLMKTRLTARDLFPFYVIVLFLPIFGEALYVSMILAPFVAILGALWFADALGRPARKRFVIMVLTLLLASSILLPVGITDRWNTRTLVGGDSVVVDDQAFNDANYGLHTSSSYYAVCNVFHTEARLETFSRMNFLGSGIPSILNGDVDAESVKENITKGSTSFPKNIYNWFDYSQEPYIDVYIRRLFIDGVSIMDSPEGFGAPVDYFSSHSRLVVVIDDRWPSDFLTAYTVLPANFPDELLLSTQTYRADGEDSSSRFCSYAYYRSSLITMYAVQLS